MPGTILNAEDYKSKTGRLCIRFTIEYENDISFAYIPVEAPHTLTTLCHWTYVPVISKKSGICYINLEKFKNKLVPMKSVQYNGKTYWTIDEKQIARNIIQRWGEYSAKWNR